MLSPFQGAPSTRNRLTWTCVLLRRATPSDHQLIRRASALFPREGLPGRWNCRIAGGRPDVGVREYIRAIANTSPAFFSSSCAA